MKSRTLILAGLLVAAATVAPAQDTTTDTTTDPTTGTTPETTKVVEPAPATKAAETTAGISLAQLAVCTSVEERKPVGESEQFGSDVGQLWCFTKVLNADAPTQVFHRWYVGETLVNEIPINVKGTHWRCWSAKTIRPSWTGTCRVEVLTEEGDIIGTREFTLSSSEG